MTAATAILVSFAIFAVTPVYLSNISVDFSNHLFVMYANAISGESAYASFDGDKKLLSYKGAAEIKDVINLTERGRSGAAFMPAAKDLDYDNAAAFSVGADEVRVIPAKIGNRREYAEMTFKGKRFLVWFEGFNITGRIEQAADLFPAGGVYEE